MGELTRAQEVRVDEFSVQKLRESHDTIQEKVNCLSGSGEFQDTESNYSGKFSHVPSQPAVFPSPRSMLGRDKRLPLETWNLSGTGKRFGNPRSMFDSSQTPYQGILHSTDPSATGAIPVEVCAGTPVARGEKRIGSATPMPMSARSPSTMTSFFPSGSSTQFNGCTAKTTYIGASVL